MPEPLVRFDPRTPPTDLGADSSGPYWLYRKRLAFELHTPAGLASVFPVDNNSRLPCRLVAGLRAPLLRKDAYLSAGGTRLDALGAREWEHYAAAQVATGLAVRAFAAEGAGFGCAAWTGSRPFVLERQPAGFWAPRAAVAGNFAAFARRTARGIEWETETAEGLEAGEWEPWTGLMPHPGRGRFLGDPAVALEASGTVHTAACLWKRVRTPRDYSHQLGPVLVDGKEVVTGAVDETPAGQTTARIWLPALAWTRHGLALAWQSAMPEGKEPGEVTVGIVGRGGIVPGSESRFPGFQPHLAEGGGRLYAATSVGVWSGAGAEPMARKAARPRAKKVRRKS